MKLTAGRRTGSRQGLTSLEKLLFQIGLGVVLSAFTWHHGRYVPQAIEFYLPFFKNTHPSLSLVPFVHHRHAGADRVEQCGESDRRPRRAGGRMHGAGELFVSRALALIVGIEELAQYLKFPYIEPSGQMAVLAGAIMGACLGFLVVELQSGCGVHGRYRVAGAGRINRVHRHRHPTGINAGAGRRNFCRRSAVGDDSGGLFQIHAQAHGHGAARVFLMAPLHHHFQKKGWTENQVVVRFWLVGAMLAAMALATVKLR